MSGARAVPDLRRGREPGPDGLDATIVLLRHGESTYIAEGRFQGRSETPLSEVGRRQAELAAARLARPHASPALPVPAGPPLVVVHSPLARAAETASIVAAALADPTGFGVAVACRVEDGLTEIGQGEWEGLTVAEIEARWGDRLATWRRRPLEAWAPGGESLPEVQARVRGALDALLAELAAAAPLDSLDGPQVPGYTGAGVRPGPWSIVVGHDGVFKVVLLTLFDLPLERFWSFPFVLCGLTIVEIRAGRPTLRAHNLADHLAPLLDERAGAVTEARERTGAL